MRAPSTPSPDEIRAQLEKIVSNRLFTQAGRMSRFLRFTVEQSLAGHADRLKEYTIGIEVFDRGTAYDPRVDPIVRVEARRLRFKLKRYYETAGQPDPIVIEYAKGGYAPAFLPRDHNRSAPAITAAPGRTIAVLPFANLSADTDSEYFSDGLTQELIHRLTKVRALSVVAWNSAIQLKGSAGHARRAGEQLGVEAVLEGSVRAWGRRLRIAAQLTRVADGVYLWSETYEREMEDVFAIQDEISRAIVSALEPRLVGEPALDATRPPRTNTRAYSLYLRGRFHWNKRTDAGLTKSIEYFEQAIAEDPAYALGHAGLADAYSLLADYGLLAPERAMPKAKEAALRALELEPTLGEARTSLAYVLAIWEWEWEAAGREFQRALDLNPGYATAQCWYATEYLTPRGRMDEAFKTLRRAQQLDPLSRIIAVCIAENLMMRGRNEEAIAEYFKALELDSHFYKCYSGMARCYLQKGMYQEAIALFEKARGMAGDIPTILGPMAQAFALGGLEDQARSLLTRLRELGSRRFVAQATLAVVHLCLGEREEALTLLERGCERRETQMILLAVHPAYEPLRGEPRFRALLERIGLPIEEGRGAS